MEPDAPENDAKAEDLATLLHDTIERFQRHPTYLDPEEVCTTLGVVAATLDARLTRLELMIAEVRAPRIEEAP